MILLGSCFLGLRLLDVRDWRCYGATLAGIELLVGVRLGAISPLLVLGLALVWRWRDRRVSGGLAAATVVLSKLFLWPIMLWLLATRRIGAAVVAATTGALAIALWALVDFGTLRHYPGLLRVLATAEQGRSYSLVALCLALGLSAAASHLVAIGAGALAALAIFVLARQPDGDRMALAAAIGACFLLTPILWIHYFVLLLVPIALASPRLSWLWGLPLLFWIKPFQSDPGGAAWQISLGLSVAALILVASAFQLGLDTSIERAGPRSGRARGARRGRRRGDA